MMPEGTCSGGLRGQRRYTNGYIIELLEELLEILSTSSLYEGISVPERFDELPPSWRAWYLLKAGGDRGKAEELFRRGDGDRDFMEYEVFMNRRLSSMLFNWFFFEVNFSISNTLGLIVMYGRCREVKLYR